MRSKKTDIEKILSRYIEDECLPKNCGQNLSYDKNLFEAGIIDSAGLITYISYIEKKFKIVIPDEDLLPEYFCSVNAIAGYIRSKQNVSKKIYYQEELKDAVS